MERAFKWLLGGPLPVDELACLVETMAFQFDGILVNEWNTSQAHIGIIEISDGKLALTRVSDIDVKNMSGDLLATCKGHRAVIMCLVALKHGLFASGAADGTVKVWASSGREVAHLEGHACTVIQLCALPDGCLASLDEKAIVKIWQDAVCITSFDVSNGILECWIGIRPAGLAALSSGLIAILLGGTVAIWNSRTGLLVKKLDNHRMFATTMVALDEEAIMVSGLRKGRLVYEIWNTTTCMRLKRFDGFSDWYKFQAVLLPDGSVATRSRCETWFTVIAPDYSIRRVHTKYHVSGLVSTSRGLATLHPNMVCIWK
jgi:WD40 repeat protein